MDESYDALQHSDGHDRAHQTVARLSGKIHIDSVEHDVSELFSTHARDIQNTVNKTEQERLNKAVTSATGNASVVRYMSWISVLFMQVGLILLCLSAMKLLLSL